VTIRVLVADDEPLARRRLIRFLQFESDVEVVAECATGESTLAALDAVEVDLAILDVRMPDMDGFAVVAARTPARMPPVIFATAYDEYAVRAFEVHAIDYVLKPTRADRFRAAFRVAREHLAQRSEVENGRRLRALLEQSLRDPAVAAMGPASSHNVPAPSAPPTPIDRIVVKSERRVFFVRATDIDWVEAQGNYVRIHVGRVSHLVRESITALATSLSPTHFARIHRRTIVNLERIMELQPWFSGDHVVVLKDGTQLRLSRTYRDQLHQRLNAAI
jgi:two-component system LytT family response regulator